MARTNREQVGFIEETTWGTTPATPTGQLLNYTNMTLGQQNNTTQSAFVRSDTNVAGTIRVGTDTGGDLGIELQYGAYDLIGFEGVLRNTWGTGTDVTATDISFADSDNSINSTGGDFGDLVAGQWIRVSGSTSNDGYYAIQTATSANKIIIAGATLTTEAAGDSVTVKSQQITNGTTDKSYSIERGFLDITQYLSFTGCRVASMNLSFGLQAIANGSISFLGKSGASAGSTIWNSTTAASTNESMNTVNNIKGVYIDGVATTVDLAGLDFTVTTNAEQLNKIGQLAATDIVTNSIGVTGTLTEYFEDATFLNKALNFTEFRLTIIVGDEDGNDYAFDFPSCRIGQGSPDNGGINQTITTPYQFTATLDGTLGYTMSVARIAA